VRYAMCSAGITEGVINLPRFHTDPQLSLELAVAILRTNLAQRLKPSLGSIRQAPTKYSEEL
jgi:hypothetical protein